MEKKLQTVELEGKTQNNLTQVVSYFKRKRLDELKTRIQVLQQHNPKILMCAITGVAGTGKTELAKAYAWEFDESHTIFRWRLDPDPDTSQNNASQVSYQQAYASLLSNFSLQSLKAEESETPDQFHQRRNSILWNIIAQYSLSIVIFDNAVSYTDIERYLLPTSDIRGQIIVTTQTYRFFTDNRYRNFSINRGLHEDDAIELLKEISHRADEDVACTRTLVEKLDFSPLAIRIAGSYIYNMEEDMSFVQYTEILERDLQERGLKLMDPSFVGQAVEDPQRKVTLQGALGLSIRKIQKQNLPLFYLLETCAFLSNENIPFQLLLQLFKENSPQQDSLVTESILRAMMIGRENYSLLTYDTLTQNYYLHRTTQVALRNLITSPVETIKKMTSVILKLYPYDLYSIKPSKLCHTMEPHFLALSRHIISQPESVTGLITEHIQLLLILGQLGSRFSQYVPGFQSLQQAWNLIHSSENPDPLLQIQILEFQSAIKYQSAEFTQARKYIEQALQIYTIRDWRLARLHNALGMILYYDLGGTTQEILHSYQKAQTICENTPHPSRESTLELAISYRGIGSYLQTSKDFTGALEYLDRALKLFQSELKNSEPWLAIVYRNLGRLGLDEDAEQFINRGIDYRTSEKYLEQVLSISIEAYGPRHNDVAIGYKWISCLLYTSSDPADWEISLKYITQTIQIQIRIFGPTYSLLIESYYLKGKILCKLNRVSEAQNTYQHSLDLGREYPGKHISWIQKSRERVQEIERQLQTAVNIVNYTSNDHQS